MTKKKKINKLRNYVDLYYGSSNKFVTKGTDVKIWKSEFRQYGACYLIFYSFKTYKCQELWWISRSSNK